MHGDVFDFVVYGRPVSKKNKKRIIWRQSGRPSIISSNSVLRWESNARGQLLSQKPRQPIEGELYVEVFSYLSGSQKSDVDNLACAPLDALQSARIIRNDYQVSELYSVRLRDPDCPRVIMRLARRKAGSDRSPIITEPLSISLKPI